MVRIILEAAEKIRYLRRHGHTLIWAFILEAVLDPDQGGLDTLLIE